MGRTATKSIVEFFKKFGINAHHQAYPIPFETRGHKYDLINIPKHEIDYAIMKANKIKQNEEYFEACWTLSYYIYLLEKQLPEMKQIVCVRNYEQNALSLWSLRRYGEINDYVEEWIELYSFVLEQIKLMKTKPKILFFENLIKGEYNDFLLNLFNLDDTQGLAKDHWNIKINSVPKNESQYVIRPELAKRCEKIMEELKNVADTF